TVRALTLRVALSIGLFVLLMIAYATGWLTPHGIFVGSVDVVPQASFGSGQAQGH
ncbi:MAG: DUF2909 domain-containing protein, partial [Burkholderiales bacterium]